MPPFKNGGQTPIFRKIGVCPLFFLLAPGLLHAVFIKTELDRIDTEEQYVSEYFLDLLSFRYPLPWQTQWAQGKGGYRINAASLDRTDLILTQEVLFSRELLGGLSFGYHLDQTADKELQNFHQWVHLRKEVGGGLSLIVFGEPTFEKEDSDTGFGAQWETPWGPRLRVAYNAVDWNFNLRTRTTQAYIQKPYTWDAGLEMDLGLDRFALSAQFDTPLLRNIPDENRQYRYRRTVAEARWERLRSDRPFFVRYRHDFKRESDAFAPDLLAAGVDFHRSLHELEAAALLTRGKDAFEAGQNMMFRDAQADHGTNATASRSYFRWEFMPYVRWRRALKPWLVSEAASYLSFGEDNRRFPQDPARTDNKMIVEHKVGLGMDFIFGTRGLFSLYTTFYAPPDSLRTIWGGGSARAAFLF